MKTFIALTFILATFFSGADRFNPASENDRLNVIVYIDGYALQNTGFTVSELLDAEYLGLALTKSKVMGIISNGLEPIVFNDFQSLKRELSLILNQDMPYQLQQFWKDDVKLLADKFNNQGDVVIILTSTGQFENSNDFFVHLSNIMQIALLKESKTSLRSQIHVFGRNLSEEKVFESVSVYFH
ncbi:MAG: hypothetical protein JJU02_09440 [Cryomorphaceae bacterium]|nr:hypothetical protein [Cryomorphaceae bacterium]